MAEQEPHRSGNGEEGLTVQEALAYGVELIAKHQLDTAAALFRRILEVSPDQPDALNFLGIVCYHLGDRKEGVEYVKRAAAVLPDHAGIQNNLSNMLIEAGDLDGAVEAYKRSVALDRTQPEPVNNLASVLKARRDYAEAEELLRHALELDPKHGPAHHNLGEVLLRTDRPKEAIDHYWKAAFYMPSQDFNPYFIALAYDRQGQRQTAIEVLQDWLTKDPGNVQVKHLLSGFTGEAVPARAANEFVEVVFDGFANSFESRLAHLEYQAPKLVGDAFKAVVGEPHGDLKILDAGCGTGLCAQHLRAYAKHLSGVDLSNGMLNKARTTRLYDELTKGELTEFLASKNAEYDAVISADTLCYFGHLEDFAAAAAGAIKTGGTLIFTVEALDDSAPKEHTITISGRYAHSGRYLDRVLPAAGFTVVARESKVLRMENLEPVAGYVVTARRT